MQTESTKTGVFSGGLIGLIHYKVIIPRKYSPGDGLSAC